MHGTVTASAKAHASTPLTYFASKTIVEFVSRGETILRMERESALPTAEVDMAAKGPVHPGTVLHDEFLLPHGLSSNKLAIKLGVPPNSIIAIINGTRGISGPMSILLGRAFGVAPDYFANLHTRYLLDVAAQEAEHDQTAATRLRRADAFALELRRA